ncbi:MAG: diguanylate phosphodiesterase [Deltaproteobacteria bacterium]|nr:diguanylate phosphodiesterase [Deltaproteobacteria bacterium]
MDWRQALHSAEPSVDTGETLVVVRPEQPGIEEGSKPIVVCVDDDHSNLQALGRVLSARCTVLLANSGLEALELVNANTDVACVLADLRMPGLAGAELLARVAEIRPHCRRAVVTGFPESEDLIGAINAGQLHYVITKPWKLQDLLQVVDQLVHTHKLERDNARLMAELRLANTQLRDHEQVLEAQLEVRGREISAATEQLAQMNHQLDALTLRDALTGLYSHRAFQERLREEVARALRYGQPMSLLIADIDGFASINHDLGYQMGDEILRHIAVVLQEDDSPDRARLSDIVARYSGEEFVLLLPETPKAGALVKAGRLRDAIANAEMPGGRKMSMSIGIASLPEDAADPEGLLTAAEAAVRGAKRGGPGRVHLFSSGDDASDKRPTRTFGRIREPDLDRFRPYQERMAEVHTILMRDRALSCLLVDLSRLHRVELDLGVAHHSEIYDHAAAVLDRLRGAVLDPADLICRTGDGDGYYIILSPRAPNQRVDLEALSASVETAIEEALAPMVTAVLREQPRITVGSARVLGNSLLRPERLTARLIADACAATRNACERKAHRDRSTLQDVILGEGLSTVYQPIVDLGTGDIFAYEALTRGPRGTALESPATLFAIADEVDLTVELDRACFRGALRNAMTLEPVHRLFVNLLPMSFYDTNFIEVEVGNLLTAAGLTPANIVFEITERLAIDNFTSFKRALGAYTAMGFGIAIDDVGTRHSNLETVMSLRPHFIKISEVLVRGIARSTVKREMLRSLRHIAETIDAVMIAEGIEHVEDVAALRDLGLRYGQGYYMARPAPPFVSLGDDVRAELRAITPNVQTSRLVPQDEDDEDEDRELAIPRTPSTQVSRAPGIASGSKNGIPRNAFGRPEDEITSDFTLREAERPRPRASQPLVSADGTQDQAWKPLVDEEGTNPGQPLLDALRNPENTPDGERGGGRPGLN